MGLTNDEVNKITMQRLIRVDGKIRTDKNYPTGFMDVVTIQKTGEHFRILYDVKGRFIAHRISEEEAKYKLCKVTSVGMGPKKVPYITTTDGRTIRYPDPLVKSNDSVLFDIESKNLCMVTRGRNMGRVGVIMSRDRHAGSFDIVHIKDSVGHTFATRLTNVFVIGKGTKAYISLPRGKGIKLTIAEERDHRLAKKAAMA